MRDNYILSVNCPEYPASAVEIDAHRPSGCRLTTSGRETSHSNVGPLALGPGDGIVDGAGYGLQGTTARDKRAACSRRLYGLQVYLLLVENVLIVESSIFGVDTLEDRFVEGIRWLGTHDGGGRYAGGLANKQASDRRDI